MTTPTVDRIEDLTSAIRLFRKLAGIAEGSANGYTGQLFPELRVKWLKQARRRTKAAARLAKLLAKECDKLKEEFK